MYTGHIGHIEHICKQGILAVLVKASKRDRAGVGAGVGNGIGASSGTGAGSGAGASVGAGAGIEIETGAESGIGSEPEATRPQTSETGDRASTRIDRAL